MGKEGFDLVASADIWIPDRFDEGDAEWWSRLSVLSGTKAGKVEPSGLLKPQGDRASERYGFTHRRSMR